MTSIPWGAISKLGPLLSVAGQHLFGGIRERQQPPVQAERLEYLERRVHALESDIEGLRRSVIMQRWMILISIGIAAIAGIVFFVVR